MKLIDTHCHLSFDPLVATLDDVLSRAANRGVSRVVVPAYDLQSWDDVERIGALEPILSALGLHPWVADESLNVDDLKARLTKTRAVAIGEIGLDFKIESPSRERQIDVFVGQMELAQKMDLPVLLHCRGAFEEMLDILDDLKPIRGSLHAYSRGPELMRRFLDLGLHIAFGGAITRPRAKQARRSATLVPEDRMLLETDAPSIGLDGVEPKDVEPHHVADIAEALASLRGWDEKEIARSTTRNAEILFRLDA
jgi:TatD DNase family protein